jgi:hypothetical protein
VDTIRRFGIVALSAAAALALAEGLVRVSGIAAHLYTDPAFETSPNGKYWRYKPGFVGTLLGPTEVRIGPLGERVHDQAAGPEGSAFEIAVFGDSITMGQGVAADETYSAVLEEKLSRGGAPANISNFGVQGHSLEMIVEHVEDVEQTLTPDLTILAIIEDDLNPERGESRVDRFGYLTKRVFGSASTWQDLLRAGMRHSHLILAAKAEYLRLSAAPRARGRASGGAEPKTVSRYREAMKRFEAATRGSARLVVSLEPSQGPLSREFARIMSDEMPAIPFVEVHELTKDIAVADLRVPRDGHPNARAHALFAEALYGPVLSAIRGGAEASGARSSRGGGRDPGMAAPDPELAGTGAQ